MSERPHEQLPSVEHNKATIVAASVTGGFAGTVYGAAMANYVFPERIEYVEGVSAHSSMTFNSGVVVDGRLNDLVAPNALSKIPVPAIDGVHAALDKPHLGSQNSKLMGEYVSAITNFQDTVKDTGILIAHHVAAGAGIGAVLGAGLAYGTVLSARHFKKHRHEVDKEVKRLRGRQDEGDLESAERQEKDFNKENMWRKIRLGSAIGAVLLLGGITANKAAEIESPVQGPGEPLTPLITDKVAALRGAKIYCGGAQINIAILKVNNLINKAESTWKKGNANFEIAYKQYRKSTGEKFKINPDIATLTHFSDLHCNFANYKYFFGPVMKIVSPDVAAFTGDVQTNSNTMFFEKRCVPGMVNIFKEAGEANGKTIPLVSVAGNHDDKKPRHDGPNNYELTRYNMVKEIHLGNGDDPSAATLTFVGEQDPRSTIKFPTTPVKLEDQLKGLAAQGEDMANRACREEAEGKTVIEMAHGDQAGYAAASRGCATLILNGHTHHDEPVKAILGDNGKVVLQYTAGSASGALEGFSVYEAPQQKASFATFYYSKSQHQFVGYYTTTLYKDGTVSIKYKDIPPKVEPPAVNKFMKAFQGQFAKTATLAKSNENAATKDKIAVIKNGGLAGR